MSVAVHIACLLMQILPVYVFCCFISKIPDINIVCRCAANLYSALLTENIQCFFKVLGIYICCTLYCCNCSITEFKHCHSDILCFKIVMKLLTGYPIYFFDFITHHPSKQINSMNTLIHQAPSIILPCASPWSLVIVPFVSVPSDMD